VLWHCYIIVGAVLVQCCCSVGTVSLFSLILCYWCVDALYFSVVVYFVLFLSMTLVGPCVAAVGTEPFTYSAACDTSTMHIHAAPVYTVATAKAAPVYAFSDWVELA
jgi:hypothetical protein